MPEKLYKCSYCHEGNSEAQSDVAMLNDKLAALEAEVQAWRERFKQYEYRPQDHGVFLKFSYQVEVHHA